MPRENHAIWVDIDAKKTMNGRMLPAGELVQVKGSMQQGMSFEVRDGIDPEMSYEGKEKIKIGAINRTDLERLKQTCSEVSTPPKQYDRAKLIDPSKPLYHCQQWTRDAIERSRAAGVLSVKVELGAVRPDIPKVNWGRTTTILSLPIETCCSHGTASLKRVFDRSPPCLTYAAFESELQWHNKPSPPL
ncbi:hypothetical protein LTR70_004918 [Exophiala xenobiotica]|uniref:Uncharacterized protein n=1 Tax=Lithohypha guttulata TaxID=1690604 RepID=A0ABR0KBR3_9EURO|nr:hypothetical protein LTR24_004550 [Lithohypha guttulata]KAK5319734.1 hypothetical protein LTR70_004918 [Exophiala xenobiotica]